MSKPCVMCGKPAQAGDFCPDCYKGLEERYRPREAAPSKPPRDWRPVLWSAAAACLAVAALRAPSAVKAFSPPKPFRAGAVDTDAAADRCLRSLWTASRLIQEGRWPSPGFACPSTGRPYLTEGTGPDLSVRCPSPEAHRLSSLSVSRRNPVPEARP
jgi:hypothetical protein